MRAIAIICAVLGIVVLSAIMGRQNFRSRIRAEVRELFAETLAGVGSEQLTARWHVLPEPLRRHLQYAIPKDAPSIQTARLKHGGFFRIKPGQGWLPIKGEQYFTAAKPGFVWNASIRPVRPLWIEARDRLLFGRGSMLVKLLSLLTIADASGPAINQGASLRWLAECVWFPYALVGDLIRWEGIDAHSCRATLLLENRTVSAVFQIDDEGKLTSLQADRYRDVGSGPAVLTRWIGRYSQYRDFKGFCVPTYVEVAWEIDDVPFTYARFQIAALEYNIAEPF